MQAIKPQPPRTVEQYAPLIHKFAYRFYQRSQGLNSSRDLEDIRQELTLIFLRCCKSYDETKGSTFMNFVISSWFNEMNRLMLKDQRNREVAYTVSAQNGDDEEEAFSLFDRVDSGWASPEQNAEALSSMQFTLEGLSDQARLLVETLINPSEAVCHQYDLRERGALQRRNSGEDRRGSRHLNLAFLFLLFKVPAAAARDLRAEIQSRTALAFDL